MSQVLNLLWKNFLYCRRHPIKTNLFFLIPFAMLAFIPTLILKDEIVNIQDCEYTPVSMFPNNPLLFLRSMICSQENECVNRSKKYVAIENSFSSFRQDSNICPGKSVFECTQTFS